MTEASSQIVLYEGSPLERIASRELIARNVELVKPSRFFLGSDVFSSNFGIKGFLLMDTKPEKRWLSYTDSRDVFVSIEGTAGNQEKDFGWEWEEGLERAVRTAHFLHTDMGFKMVRYFILPNDVYTLFKNQPILGEPMINQLIMTAFPEQFDETNTDFQYAFSFTHYHYGDKTAEQDSIGLANLLISVHPEAANYIGDRNNIGMRGLGSNGHRAFVSFHPWPLYEPVRQAGEASIVGALGSFDRFLSGGMVRHTIEKRMLPTQNATPYIVPYRI